MVAVGRIELPPKVYETLALPLSYTAKKIGRPGGTRTHDTSLKRRVPCPTWLPIGGANAAGGQHQQTSKQASLLKRRDRSCLPVSESSPPASAAFVLIR